MARRVFRGAWIKLEGREGEFAKKDEQISSNLRLKFLVVPKIFCKRVYFYRIP
jgi:hypothetical protein